MRVYVVRVPVSAQRCAPRSLDVRTGRGVRLLTLGQYLSIRSPQMTPGHAFDLRSTAWTEVITGDFRSWKMTQTGADLYQTC